MADNCRKSTNLIRKRTMKKSELKNIIKECVKEVIFEEGVLSGIVSEVALGMAGVQTLQENKSLRSPVQTTQPDFARKKVLSAIASDAYEDAKNRFSNPELFEGTTPIPDSSSRASALAGVASGDPGVSLDNIPGAATWAQVAAGNRK